MSEIELKGKRLLVVDDEEDILDIIEELLNQCIIDKAKDFNTAKELLDRNRYDAAILDIMGVNGYDLLEITRQKNIPAMMLTAHALSAENFYNSIEKGAYAYVPKDNISEIEFFLKAILLAHHEGKRKLGSWFSRLEPFFEEKFGMYWKERLKQDPEFWKKYM